MFDILTAGSITLDTFIQPEELENFTKNQTEYFGFEIGGKIKIQTQAKHVGGGAANSAVGFQKMDFATATLGTLGRDDHGKFILHDLECKNVNTKFIQWQQNKPSSSSIIVTLPDGRRTVLHERTTALPFSTLPDAKALYVGHLADTEESLFELFPTWKTQSRLFAWNPGKTQFKKGLSHYKSVTPLCDILIVNKEEAELFTKTKATPVSHTEMQPKACFTPENTEPTLFDAAPMAQVFLNAGIKQIVITDSRRGAQYFSAQYPNGLFVPQIDMKKPVSTLGAGDSFSVGVVSAFLQGKNPSEMLLWGSLNASSVVQEFGAQNGLLSRKEITTRAQKFL
ncbi:hypothetical protein CSB37_00510 [bacterium DOLZORAL124_38_8]|nr:MAG: hypothetical protein CSB37_00510 [bacterium DOLZORAL124_38_8]